MRKNRGKKLLLKNNGGGQLQLRKKRRLCFRRRSEREGRLTVICLNLMLLGIRKIPISNPSKVGGKGKEWKKRLRPIPRKKKGKKRLNMKMMTMRKRCSRSPRRAGVWSRSTKSMRH